MALLASASRHGPTAASDSRAQTFRIHGTIRTYSDSAVRAEVGFARVNYSKTVFSDDRGVYEADLPVGQYTMTADALAPIDLDLPFFTKAPAQEVYDGRLEEYRRPLFRVAVPASITLDVTLSPVVYCEPGLPASGSVPDDYRGCQEWDLFPVPSQDGVPF